MRLELPILCFTTLPLLLWTLPTHIRARNVAFATLTITLLLVNLIRGVNCVSS
jgi:hypothetical protein